MNELYILILLFGGERERGRETTEGDRREDTEEKEEKRRKKNFADKRRREKKWRRSMQHSWNACLFAIDFLYHKNPLHNEEYAPLKTIYYLLFKQKKSVFIDLLFIVSSILRIATF